MKRYEIGLYAALFIILDLIFIFIASKIIPYGGFFPYKEVLIEYHLPHLLSSLANFDGIHYLLISSQGYAEYQQAFFPLYPLLIYILNPVFAGNYLITGLMISFFSFIVGLYFFIKLLPSITKAPQKLIIFFLLIFPTSFYFHVVYTESLFFMLFIGALYFLERKNYAAACIFALLCSTTRLAGVFLFIPFFLTLWDKKRLNATTVLITITPFIGLATYCFYLWRTTGDPLFFFNAQPAFGANRSTNIILLPQVYFRYFKILLTTPWNFPYFVALIEMVLFTMVLGFLLYEAYKIYRAQKIFEKPLRTGLLLFSLVNIILPTLTGTFSSVPRYSLLSFSLYIILAELQNKYLKAVIIIFFCVLHLLLLGFFTQGYFVG